VLFREVTDWRGEAVAKNLNKKTSIRRKITTLLLALVLTTLCLTGAVSIWSLYSMKTISEESSSKLGKTAADDSERALEEMAAEHLQDIAEEKSLYIDGKFEIVESYVKGIAALAADIYSNPGNYPDRHVNVPQKDSVELAAQLLWSQRLDTDADESVNEILKLGNIQDLLVQYNAQSKMVSSTYLATDTGWMIQADYIAYTKYDESGTQLYYEANQRQWFQRASNVSFGEVVYTDVMKDIHEGGDCIVCASPVYLNGELVAVAGVGSYLDTIQEAVLNTKIGENGYAFLVNEKGQVLVSGKTEGETAASAEQAVDLRDSGNEELAQAAEYMTECEAGFMKITLDGRQVYIAYAPLERLGWSFVTVLDVAEVVAPAEESRGIILTLMQEVGQKQEAAIRKTFVNFMLVLAAVTIIVCVFGTMYSQKLTMPIRQLTEEVARIDGGNLDYRIHINTGDEVEDLGNAFNDMTEQIQEYVDNLAEATAEKEKIRTELQVASCIQADMLPKSEGAFIDYSEFNLWASMMPAKGVGGDFYDFFMLDDDNLVLIMADVSGKGVPAALFMATACTLLRSHLTGNISLENAMTEVNDCLCANNKNGMFVTTFVGILTLSTGILTYVNAGHCKPIICRKNGKCSYEEHYGGFVLAGLEEEAYTQTTMKMDNGDTLLLYTDGVTEATSREKELYGEERLLQFAVEHDGLAPKEMIEALWKSVEDWQKDAEQFDDVTMLAVTYNGNGYETKTDKACVENIPYFMDFIENILKMDGVDKKNMRTILMAADELLSNICYYSGALEMTVGIKVNQNIILYFEDDGKPYDPLNKPDPDVDKFLEEGRIGGFGIYLVKQRMEEVKYEYANNRNRLIIEKRGKVTRQK
jgi:sigma-B regulation protein RsbU (phosphoserine phosphatase)